VRGRFAAAVSAPPSAATPSAPTGAPKPVAPPAAPPATPAKPPPAPPPPLAGEATDTGASRRDSVRLLRWTVRGSAKVLGPVEVGVVEADGLLSVGGNLSAGDVRVRGALLALGTTRCTGQLDVVGSARFGAPVEAASLSLRSRSEFAAGLRVSGEAKVDGLLTLPGDLEAGRLEFSGSLSVGGLLSADEVHGTLEGESRATTVRAKRLELARPSFPPWKRGGSFRAERIDADIVRLEGTRVEYLCAKEIHLGPDCHVARAEGTIVERHRSSHVGYESKSPPPPGLFR
jgi:cytoskeletal protein CcmA (bactofilin family)